FFSSTDTAYLIFMVIGVVGYFTIPGVANYIVHAGGGNALLQKVNTLVSQSSNSVVAAGSSSSGMLADALGDQRGRITHGMASFAQSSGYFGSGQSALSDYQKDKLSGN
ncbi:MAG TPA: conjugative transposon protein TraJ, partial [Sphingobacteriaceae bacterium]